MPFRRVLFWSIFSVLTERKGRKKDAIIYCALQEALIFDNGLVTANRKEMKRMSVVIVGGNECMVRQYKELCREYKCKAKIFPKWQGT